MNGVRAPDITQPFHYCDLGCGYGLTLSLLAASIPHAHFWGIDFNKEHIDRAKEMATRANLTNVTFIEADFGAIGRGDVVLPEMSYVVAHGVMSWVGDVVRGQFLSALQRITQPGGVAYISYNSMPGQALLGVLRDMMNTYTANMQADVLQKVKKGLGYLEFLRDNGAPFFEQNPLAARVLEDLKRRDPKYLAHEYFTQHRRAFYVQEMASLMDGYGFGFVGSLPLFKNVVELCAPSAFTETLQGAKTRIQRETHSDMVCNASFRRDLWVREPAERAEPEALMAETIYGAVHPRFALGGEASLDWVDLSYDSPLFEKILDFLSLRSGTVWEVSEGVGGERGEVGYGLEVLGLGSQIVPFLRPTRPVTAAALGAKRYRVVSGFNRGLFERQVWGLEMVPVASEVAGTALLVNFFEALVMLGLEVCDVGEIEGWVGEALSRRGVSLTGGRKGEARETEGPEGLGQAELVRRGVKRFLADHLPKMLELGVIEPIA